ncbi:MAG: glycosyltransferase family 2 protein [Candidatus Krumholzibacteriota bacterium]|nr:glycosyltransferase family 2 protein [Candidatus Krumholzibacteriota bacterium]
MSEKLSVVIITKNEERNIRRCLESVRWADEIVVIDSGSTDKTLSICREYGCRVVETEWLGFGRTRQLAVEKASNDWILSIDSDEEVSSELAERIREILSEKIDKCGFKFKRITFYIGRLIKHSGWNREYCLRLFNRKYGSYNSRDVHEYVEIKGETGRIEEEIMHYSYHTISDHLKKIDKYTTLGARQLFNQGKKSSVFKAILRAKFRFIKMYFINMGFLDGKEGLILAFNSAFYVFLKYIKLWEKHNK